LSVGSRDFRAIGDVPLAIAFKYGRKLVVHGGLWGYDTATRRPLSNCRRASGLPGDKWDGLQPFL
jgi:hypothetical protein